jgi:hypothetical protein
MSKHDIEIPAPLPGTFTVTVLDHKGLGATGIFKGEMAADIFDRIEREVPAYDVTVRGLYLCLKKHRRKPTDDNAELACCAALAVLIRSPYSSPDAFRSEFSRLLMRECNCAALTVLLGKRRGVFIAVAERGIDARTAFKKCAKGGGRPLTIRREQEVERFDA